MHGHATKDAPRSSSVLLQLRQLPEICTSMAMARWRCHLPDLREQEGEVLGKPEPLAMQQPSPEAAVLGEGWHNL